MINCRPAKTKSQTKTITSFPFSLVLFASDFVIMISSVIECCIVGFVVQTISLMSEVQKIDQWDDKHPYQIYKVPVQAQHLDVVGVIAAALIAYADHDQREDPGGDVGEMQTGDAEK